MLFGMIFFLITLPFRVLYWFFKAIWEIVEFFHKRLHRKRHHRRR